VLTAETWIKFKFFNDVFPELRVGHNCCSIETFGFDDTALPGRLP
jgi:hypothetical protein